LDKGWGFVTVNNTDVQADNAAGLNKGIIGLVNKGKPRSLTGLGRVARLGLVGQQGDRLSARPTPM
jgi:hypothetical protein